MRTSTAATLTQLLNLRQELLNFHVVDSPVDVVELETINSSLSAKVDVTQAQRLYANIHSGTCYQGQTHGHEGFLLTPLQVQELQQDANMQPVIHPYLTIEELLTYGQPQRYVIDLNHCDDLISAMKYGKAFTYLSEHVLPDMKANAKEEREKTGKQTGPRQNHFQRWWKFWRGRPALIAKISALQRYIVCGQVTKRPIFEFLHNSIRPNAALIAFPLADDYSFGILQSSIHWEWFISRCSTLKGDYRYTVDTVFDSFPWPQSPSEQHMKDVATASVHLRQLRREIMRQNSWNLRELYRTLEMPGKNALRETHSLLDTAVHDAYGMKTNEDILSFLLDLNLKLANDEIVMKRIAGPGLPPNIKESHAFITDDCIKL